MVPLIPFSDFQADCKQPTSKDTINVVSRRVRNRIKENQGESRRTESLYTYTSIHIQIHSTQVYTQKSPYTACVETEVMI